MTLLEWALEYARDGAAVIPLHTPTEAGCSCRNRKCENVGKHPRTLHGLADATADAEVIRRWWLMWPAANIGIRPAEGLIVVDVDPRNGGDVQLAAMQDRFEQLPATLTATTGSGGLHLWFACPGPVRGKLAEGLDIKSHSGYLVAPPSVHECGGTYRWTDESPIADAPHFLRRLLAIPKTTRRVVTSGASPQMVAGLVRAVAEAQEGARNRLLYWACCRAYERGLDVGALIDAAEANGLDRGSAEATARSAAKAPSKVGSTSR